MLFQTLKSFWQQRAFTLNLSHCTCWWAVSFFFSSDAHQGWWQIREESKFASTEASLPCCSYRGLPLGVLSINIWILNLESWRGDMTWPTDKYKYTDKYIWKTPSKSESRDVWPLRHWLQFWQLNTWYHDNRCDLTIRRHWTTFAILGMFSLLDIDKANQKLTNVLR